MCLTTYFYTVDSDAKSLNKIEQKANLLFTVKTL